MGNIHVFHIIFDVYDTYGVEVSAHMFLSYSFSFKDRRQWSAVILAKGGYLWF